MNPKLQTFLKDQKEKEKDRIDKHLIRLGLIDDSKERKESYADFNQGDFTYYDRKSDRYIKVTKGAIDVTDSEYEEICKYFPDTLEYNINSSNTVADTYTVIAVIIFILGLIGLIVGLSTENILLGVISIVTAFLSGMFYLAVSQIIKLLQIISNK